MGKTNQKTEVRTYIRAYQQNRTKIRGQGKCLDQGFSTFFRYKVEHCFKEIHVPILSYFYSHKVYTQYLINNLCTLCYPLTHH